MKHKVRALVQVEKYSLFGKQKVFEERTITVDGKTYRKMKKAERKANRGGMPMRLSFMCRHPTGGSPRYRRTYSV